MENNFNFKSQICTSIEQSNRLLEFGLKKETADMHGTKVKKASYPEYTGFLMPEPCTKNSDWEQIPAWSLHRLWELLDKIKKYEGEDELSYPRISLVEEDVIIKNLKVDG